MSTHLVKLALVVMMDRGVPYAVAMAETGLLGLVGAATLPLAYAVAVAAGWRVPGVVAAAVGSYLAAASAAGLLFPPGSEGGGCLAISALAVLTAATLAGRVAVPEAASRVVLVPRSAARTWALRTVIPPACLLAAIGVGGALGPGGAGLMSTFPGMTLTILLMTHLEGGSGPATRMARAFPPGNLGMVAFLAVFRFGVPGLGLGWATALGYLAAVATLAIVARYGLRGIARDRARDRSRRRTADPAAPAWPRDCRRFSPRVESVAA